MLAQAAVLALYTRTATNGPDLDQRWNRLSPDEHLMSRASFCLTAWLHSLPLAVLGAVQKLNYTGLKLTSGDEWCSPTRLAEALVLCTSLKRVQLKGMRLTDDAMAELFGGLCKPLSLASDVLPQLERLELMGNRFGARGVAALCDVFAHGVAARLQILELQVNSLDDEAAKVLAAAVRSGRVPGELKRITLQVNDVGDEGATALARALLASGGAAATHGYR